MISQVAVKMIDQHDTNTNLNEHHRQFHLTAERHYLPMDKFNLQAKCD